MATNEPKDGDITHIAGPAICVEGRWVQRCSWCGAKLLDTEGTETPTVPSRNQKPSQFQQGRLVRVSAGNPTSMVVLPDTSKLPKDSCEALA